MLLCLGVSRVGRYPMTGRIWHTYGYNVLADTRVNHTGALAVSNYLGSSLPAEILTFVLNSLYGLSKINICSHFIT